jgi:hypothetical protein
MKHYAVFEHRGDGRYRLADAMASRAWTTERGAQRYADQLNAYPDMIRLSPRGFVVRSSDAFSARLTAISGTGRVSLIVPCPCKNPPHAIDACCPHHGTTDAEATTEATARELFDRR